MNRPYISELAGRFDPIDIAAYRKTGGFSGLKRAVSGTPEAVVDSITASGLKGRGGAGFDTGAKWASLVREGERYVVCNADEGEPGTFKDRYIMEKVPFLVIEGLTSAAYAVGSRKGFIYIRGEYPEVEEIVRRALDTARDAGFLGKNILGSGFDFDIEIKKGGGSYVVGDETALLASLMGNRGYPWMKPPFPTEKGLWDRPTVINNVETLAYAALILNLGPEAFKSIGPPESPGPKLFCASGHVKSPGVYEFPMGTPLREVLEKAGGMKGSFKAVQIGGTAGPIYDEKALDYPLDYSSLRHRGGALGSGALVFLNSTVGMAQVLEVVARFFAEESCGQCFPCRYGTRQLHFMADGIARGTGKLSYLDLIRDTIKTMDGASFCPFGQSVILPVATILDNFGEELELFIKQQVYMKEAV
jgi:NADH-quinone oxidoreductase subunit F